MSGENLSDNIQEKKCKVIIDYMIDTLLAKRDENEFERQGTTISYETALQKVKEDEKPLYGTEEERIAIERERARRKKIFRDVVLTNEEIQKIISYVKEGIRGEDLKSFNDVNNAYESVAIIKEALRRLMVKKCLTNKIELDILEGIIPSTKEGDKGEKIRS